MTSRGVELDVAGQVTRDWRLTGCVLAVYENAFEDGSRYGVGGGATHMGVRLGETGMDFDLPAYTTAKLVAYGRATPGAPRSFMLGLQAKF